MGLSPSTADDRGFARKQNETCFGQNFLSACGADAARSTKCWETMRKESSMTRTKSLFAVLLLIAIVGIVPQSQAQTLKVVIAGSSAMWQTLALGAYNGGTCSPLLTGCTGNTFHYTSTGNFNLTDTRSTVPTVDAGAIWIVWDSASPINVWAYIKVDSVVGVRCYFAALHCNVNVTSF